MVDDLRTTQKAETLTSVVTRCPELLVTGQDGPPAALMG